MSQIIEVTPEIYKRLESLVEGFETPNKVIERLLDFYEINAKSRPKKIGKDERLFSNSEIQKKITDLASTFDESKLLKYCDKEYSKTELGISFPLFVRVPAASSQTTKKNAVKSTDGVSRWTWKYEFQKHEYSYAVCTQWYPVHDKNVNEWLQKN